MIRAPGTYLAKALGMQEGFAQTGTPQVEVRFEVVDGEEKGAQIIWYGYLTDAAYERTIEALRHTGWTGGPDSNDVCDHDGCGSQLCKIVVEEEDYNGKVRLRVRWVNGITKPREPLDDKSKDFFRQLKSKIKPPRSKATPKPKQTALDDDYPF